MQSMVLLFLMCLLLAAHHPLPQDCAVGVCPYLPPRHRALGIKPKQAPTLSYLVLPQLLPH